MREVGAGDDAFVQKFTLLTHMVYLKFAVLISLLAPFAALDT